MDMFYFTLVEKKAETLKYLYIHRGLLLQDQLIKKI